MLAAASLGCWLVALSCRPAHGLRQRVHLVNLAHLHLLLNHVPTIGFSLGIGLLAASFVRDSEDLRRASHVVFFGVALVAIPAYLSGNAAHYILQTEPDLAQEVVTAHQNAAMVALIPWRSRGSSVGWPCGDSGGGTGRLSWSCRSWPSLLMARAANIGGQIRHPEILGRGIRLCAGVAQPRDPGSGVRSRQPLGLADLRGLTLRRTVSPLRRDVAREPANGGFINGVPLADVNRLLPWAMAGLGINIITGMLFFLAAPEQYTQNSAFTWKMGLVLLGGFSLLYPTMFDQEHASTPDMLHAAITRKLIAACSLVIWIGVIFLGRFLPYLGME